MIESQARELLGDLIQPDNSLYCLKYDVTKIVIVALYLSWFPREPNSLCINNDPETNPLPLPFLEALTWWIRNKSEVPND